TPRNGAVSAATSASQRRGSTSTGAAMSRPRALRSEPSDMLGGCGAGGKGGAGRAAARSATSAHRGTSASGNATALPTVQRCPARSSLLPWSASVARGPTLAKMKSGLPLFRRQKLLISLCVFVASLLACELGLRAWLGLHGRPYSAWRTLQAIE